MKWVARLKSLGIYKLLGLTLLNALIIWSSLVLLFNQSFLLLAVLLCGGLIVNIVFIVPAAYPIRYLVPAAFFMTLMVLYPIGYTVYVAFTNYGTGHLLTMEQVVNQLENRFFRDDDSENYSFQAFRNEAGDYAILFTRSDRTLLGIDGEVEPISDDDSRLIDDNGDGEIDRINGYQRLQRAEIVRNTNELSQLAFDYGDLYQLRMRNINSFALYTQEYVFDSETQQITSLSTGKVYRPIKGAFTAEDGEQLIPGFRVTVGWENFYRLFTNPQISGPFVRVFIWTFQWAFLSVLTTFTLGLFLAVLLNDPYLHLKRLYRSLLILPYAVPAFISALIWRGLFNTEVGVINEVLMTLFNTRVPWLQDPAWAKFALILVNLWLGFPYMMVICLGALQSISEEMYEAALVDGASTWQQFRHITLPLLLVSVAPLLVAAFAFNFNNFTVVYLLTRGRPPIPGAQTPAGATDILISYTYRLAFESGRGADYGLASAVTILIFLIIGTISFFNFRFTGALEDVSKNV